MRAKILSASAGSGKTYRLAYKYVHDTIKYFYEKPHLYRAILAVTFTNKATEEMKSRILKEINDIVQKTAKSSYLKDLKRDTGLTEQEIIKRAKITLSRILHDYSRFTILTIDKFFQRILRAFIKELGIDLNYNIELDTSSILSRSTDALIDDITCDEELQRWMLDFAQDNFDNNGSWDVRRNILALGKELFKESNKHTILNATAKEDLQRIIAEADKRLNLVYKQMQEIGQKAMDIIHNAGLEIDDFSYKATGVASYFSKIAEGNICYPGDRCIKIVASGKWSNNSTAQALVPALKPMFDELCNLYDNNRRLSTTLPQIKNSFRSYALLQDIYRKVLSLCNEEGVMLLSETKYILSRFVADNDAPFIYEKTGNRFERFMIDEFQDTSAKEWSNFVPLLQNAMAQSEDTSVLIVGDIKQSIYRWRGGDWRILQQGVSSALGEADTTLEFMSNNYRSLTNVVEFNNMAIERIVNNCNAELNAILEKALAAENISKVCHDELHDTLQNAYEKHSQTAQSDAEYKGYVCIERYEEEPPIAECIESVIARGYSYSDIMILHRSAKDGAMTANTLLEYKKRTNAPFNIMTQDSLVIGNSDICNFVIALMRLSQDSTDMISRAIANDYLGRAYDEELSTEEDQTLAYISQLSPEQAFEHIVMKYSLNERREEIAYLQALHQQIVAFCASKVADIQLFLKAWDESGANEALVVEKGESTIELTSIHKSKGLERKVIIIPQCKWAMKPLARSTIWATPESAGGGNQEELAKIGRFPVTYKEELRDSIYHDDYHRELVYSYVDNINLLYVALTRACEALYVYIPQSKKENIGTRLWDALQTEETKGLSRIEYGTPHPPVPPKEQAEEKQEPESVLLEKYPTSDITSSLKLSLDRYFDNDQSQSIATNRQLGILMHSIMCEATDADSVINNIGKAVTNGKINDEQAEELKGIIEREFARESITEWFSEDWDIVRNENDIISNEAIGTRRPDRVMIRGNKAIVVDYKFGSEKPKRYRDKMSEYMNLLHKMGYTDVKGYIWYLTLGEIDEVKISQNSLTL